MRTDNEIVAVGFRLTYLANQLLRSGRGISVRFDDQPLGVRRRFLRNPDASGLLI